MKKILFIFSIGMLIFITNSCKKDKLGPVVNNGVAPGSISNVIVTNLNGAASISYSLPLDSDLLYIEAKYTTKQGIVRQTKVSRYNSSITVDGFEDTSAYQVTLNAVNKGENVSFPIVVTAHPLIPIFKLVRDSLMIIKDFGGVNVAFKNLTASNLAIIVLAVDSLGNFTPANTYYTSLRTGNFSTRGLKSVDTKFGFYVRDRWGNISDTLVLHLTPLFEAKLDRTKMVGLALPTDAPLGYGGTISALFDGDITNGNNSYYHTGDAARMPQWFTFDMGVSAKISRLVWFMRMGFYYNLHNPRNVQIWGSNNPPADGSFTNWTLLATHEQVKPSGLPGGQLSQDDVTAAQAGETINFPLNTPKVRYIRFETTRNWSGGSYVNFTEISMYGDIN